MFLWRLSDNMHINTTQKTAEAKWNSAIIYYIIYTCVFPTGTCENVFHKTAISCQHVLLIFALEAQPGNQADFYLRQHYTSLTS